MANNSAIGGRFRLARPSERASIALSLAVALTVLMGAPLAAKERDPKPIEEPGPCPVDAPVRVASLDTLRHFEGLLGHCPETTVIESPAFRDNRPRGEIWHPDAVREPTDGTVAPRLHRSDRVILAAIPGAASDPARVPPSFDTRPVPARTGSGTGSARPGSVSYVAIVPPVEAFQPTYAPPVSADDGEAGDVEAVLALRPRSYSTSFDGKIAAAARTHRVDPLLLHAVIKQESGYRDRAVSHAGARGLMQVMPATGRSLGVNNPQHLFDSEVNINAGAKLLSQLWHNLGGNLDLVLAAYNAGEGAVRKYGMSVPPYRETRDYVSKVKANYRRLAGESGIAVNF